MLKRKAIEIFDDFNKIMEAENRKSEMAKEAGQEYTPHYKQRIELGWLGITLCSEYDLDSFERILKTYIDWVYNKNGVSPSCSFSHSEEGFIAACEWIDEQREKIIEEIS